MAACLITPALLTDKKKTSKKIKWQFEDSQGKNGHKPFDIPKRSLMMKQYCLLSSGQIAHRRSSVLEWVRISRIDSSVAGWGGRLLFFFFWWFGWNAACHSERPTGWTLNNKSRTPRSRRPLTSYRSQIFDTKRSCWENKGGGRSFLIFSLNTAHLSETILIFETFSTHVWVSWKMSCKKASSNWLTQERVLYCNVTVALF